MPEIDADVITTPPREWTDYLVANGEVPMPDEKWRMTKAMYALRKSPALRDDHYAETMKQLPAFNVKRLKLDPSVWFDGVQDLISGGEVCGRLAGHRPSRQSGTFYQVE